VCLSFFVLFNCRQKCDNDKMQFHVKAIKIKLASRTAHFLCLKNYSFVRYIPRRSLHRDCANINYKIFQTEIWEGKKLFYFWEAAAPLVPLSYFLFFLSFLVSFIQEHLFCCAWWDFLFVSSSFFLGWRRTEMYWVERMMNKRTVCKETIEDSKNEKVFKMFAVV
jgi:hypothetical protein